MRVNWLNKALADLDAEAEFIGQNDLDAAGKMYRHVRKSVDRLSKYPESGRPGRVLGTRELVIQGFPYIVPYRVRNSTVEVLRFFHTSRKIPKRW